MKPRRFQVACTCHFTGNLEPYQEVFVTHGLALTDPEVHQQEPSAFQRHSVRLVDAEAKTIDVLAHLSAKEEGSISPLTQIDGETGDILTSKTQDLKVPKRTAAKVTLSNGKYSQSLTRR